MAREADIINTIIDYFNLRKIPWVKFRNTGLIYHDKDGGIQYGKVKEGHSQCGAPDLVACYRGRIYLVEVKTEIGKMSEDQELFHHRWVEEGQGMVVSILARSVDEVACALQ